jgi:hypothetical protein
MNTAPPPLVDGFMGTKPWTDRNRVASAIRNDRVRLGDRAGMGRGLYATQAFAAGEPVASYHGRVIARDALFALRGSDRALFERVNEYAVATPSGGHLFQDDASAVGAHLINHSCGPNAEWAEWERGALVVRATRPIAEGEEITIHYGWVGMKAAMEKSWHACLCTAPCCTGTIELRLEWQEFGDGTGGPFLPPQEVTRRFLADIVNGVDDHERLLVRYGKDSMSMMAGATIFTQIDAGAFLDKLDAGARKAVALSFDYEHASWQRRRTIAARYVTGS